MATRGVLLDIKHLPKIMSIPGLAYTTIVVGDVYYFTSRVLIVEAILVFLSLVRGRHDRGIYVMLTEESISDQTEALLTVA